MNCEKELVVEIGGTKPVFKLKDKTALFFRSDLAVDADGAPRAYHPTNDKLALDFKANGFPFAIAHVDGKPVIQGANDPAPGFYVSMTSLEDKTKRVSDPHRYVNAEEIPYIVLPPAVMNLGGVRLGDFAVVINQKEGRSAFAIFADIGPRRELGEGSIALAKALNVAKDPKRGGAVVDLIYIVFPHAGDGTPKPLADIASRGAELFNAWGGMEQVNACFAH